MSTAGYVVITPCRNEEQYLQKTIDSMVGQTLRPQKWIIVNDGSTDKTGSVIDHAAKEHAWIQAVHRNDRGFRKSGGGVIEAFYDGYAQLGAIAWDYIVKLDGDVSFSPSYFADCIARFQIDEKLGIGGGTICSVASGGVEPEAHGDPPFHVRGAVKMYRRTCWEAIGGLHKATGWDTLDEVKANMLGWVTYTYTELKVTHYRFTGDADGSWKNWVKNGRANYITGYHPAFMLAKCISRLRDKPYVIAAAGLCVGFLGGYFKKLPQVEDRELIKYLRQQQIRRLTLRDSLWAKRT
ncbi:MAG TPA: glycosyltransferase family A protein [Candidatus Saccharimonadales bacterium]|nr:glycosyltransferase family A protein [Candidatus Saccharimonadales bacterium]